MTTQSNQDWNSLEAIRQTFQEMFVETGYIEKNDEFLNIEVEEKPVSYPGQIQPQYGDYEATGWMDAK